MANDLKNTLLIYAPVPVFEVNGALWLEAQSINGLRLWAAHFDEVIVMMPVSQDAPPEGWEPMAEHLDALDRVRIETLPMAYRPDQFFAVKSEASRKISALIDQADYLSFAIGGLFGDWGAVACDVAYRKGRRHAVWTDRVESEVTRQASLSGSFKSRLKARLYHKPMSRLEEKTIRRADLGLFHGAETFSTYKGFSRNPQLVHDVHIARVDHISADALSAKADAATDNARRLRIVYAGRAQAMKGPFDWLDVLARLMDQGVAYEAVWLGDGPDLAEMRAKVDAAGLSERIRLPGFVGDRAQVLAELRRADLFLFCHKTPESPRNLIEALISGCPIVGYDGAYARDLIGTTSGGVLTPMNDVAALAQAVVSLDADRAKLADAMRGAAVAGEPFTDTEVFAHRSAIIREHLAPVA